MHATAEIQGQDVIGLPGQNLTERELFLLVWLAEGIPSDIIAEHMALEPIAMRRIETAIQTKLGAKNRAHIITRGFTLGVLVPKALSLESVLRTS